MTLVALRARLATVFAGLLGTYTTPGGTRDAIHSGLVPPDWTVVGLEVVIESNPDWTVTPQQMESAGLEREWRVRIVQHDDDADLDPAVVRLARAFPGVRVSRIDADPSRDTPPQVLARIRE